MMEPVLCNSGCLMPLPGYLAQVRELCNRHGCLLVFDEVITGFRMSLGGAQQFFDVRPDLATFGKALGGGATVSAIAGREDIMMQVIHGGVAFGGSFNGNPVSLASVYATLSELARDNGRALRHIDAMGERLMKGIREIAVKYQMPLVITGFGAAFALHFSDRKALTNYRDTFEDNAETLQRFLRAALRHHLHLLPDGRMYVSAAHTEEDIGDTLLHMNEAFAELTEGTREAR